MYLCCDTYVCLRFGHAQTTFHLRTYAHISPRNQSRLSSICMYFIVMDATFLSLLNTVKFFILPSRWLVMREHQTKDTASSTCSWYWSLQSTWKVVGYWNPPSGVHSLMVALEWTIESCSIPTTMGDSRLLSRDITLPLALICHSGDP